MVFKNLCPCALDKSSLSIRRVKEEGTRGWCLKTTFPFLNYLTKGSAIINSFGGGTQVQRGEGGRTRVTYFAEDGVFFKTSACPRFCKRRVPFCTQVRSMGGENPLTIHEIYAALTPSDSLSDWASESAAATQADYNISITSKVKMRVPVHPMSVFW